MRLSRRHETLNHDSKVKLNLLIAIIYLLRKERKMFTIAENNKYNCSAVVSEVSFFVGNPECLNLTIYLNLSNFVFYKKVMRNEISIEL